MILILILSILIWFLSWFATGVPVSRKEEEKE